MMKLLLLVIVFFSSTSVYCQLIFNGIDVTNLSDTSGWTYDQTDDVYYKVNVGPFDKVGLRVNTLMDFVKINPSMMRYNDVLEFLSVNGFTIYQDKSYIDNTWGEEYIATAIKLDEARILRVYKRDSIECSVKWENKGGKYGDTRLDVGFIVRKQ